MNRKEAREYVMQAVFQMEAQNDFENPDMEQYLSRKSLGGQKMYVETLLKTVASNIEKIDETINANSEGWPTVRMAKVDLAIVRVATAEILFMEEVPAAVAINEAVNMAKVFGTDQSAKFINGILAKVK